MTDSQQITVHNLMFLLVLYCKSAFSVICNVSVSHSNNSYAAAAAAAAADHDDDERCIYVHTGVQ